MKRQRIQLDSSIIEKCENEICYFDSEDTCKRKRVRLSSPNSDLIDSKVQASKEDFQNTS